jgi:hypothetical protein
LFCCLALAEEQASQNKLKEFWQVLWGQQSAMANAVATVVGLD